MAKKKKSVAPRTKSAPKKRMKKSPKGRAKVEVVMEEFKEGNLHSGGSGKIVTNPKQAIAIALSEQRKVDAGKRRKKR